MTVMERLYDNTWYVRHCTPAMREQLAADVTRTWMAREAAFEHANHELHGDAGPASPARTALALSLGSAVQAEHDRAKARAAEAARCTDIVAGHAFGIHRTSGSDGAMTVDVESCTLPRRVTLMRTHGNAPWTATMHDPASRHTQRFTADFGTDAWGAQHRACAWIVTGRL